MSKSKHAVEAIEYLNKVKPTDGWALDTFLNPRRSMGKRVRILRRNVSISKDDFEDVALDTLSMCVVGIAHVSSLTEETVHGKKKLTGTGTVLVEKDGTVIRKSRIIPIALSVDPAVSTTKTVSKPSSGNPTTGNTVRRRPPPATGTRRSNENSAGNSPQIQIDPETQQIIMRYLIYALIGMVVLKIVISVVATFLVIAIPLFFFAQGTCPPDDTFDPKKELKRVLRGVHLPEDHPNKPKTWLEKTVSRVTASVATELATGLGYKLSLTHFFGFATLATVEVDVSNVKCFWLGCFNKWFYLFQRDLEDR